MHDARCVSPLEADIQLIRPTGIADIELDYETNMMDLYDGDYVCNDKQLAVLPKLTPTGSLLGKRAAEFP
jgi:hypothetical protein